MAKTRSAMSGLLKSGPCIHAISVLVGFSLGALTSGLLGALLYM